MRPLQFVERELTTDFALLHVAQFREFDLTGGSFATSQAGGVSMTCGSRFAHLHVRLERWSERPPAPIDDWEDLDELPWVSLPNSGTAVASGFDPRDSDDGLIIADLPRARVQVLARGRHRGDDVPDGAAPEQWLLRWWPDDIGLDGMAGPPRRLAGQPQHAWDAMFEVDVWQMIRWAPAGRLTTTPQAIAGRLSLPAHVVLDVLRRLQHKGSIVIDSADGAFEHASKITVTQANWPQWLEGHIVSNV